MVSPFCFEHAKRNGDFSCVKDWPREKGPIIELVDRRPNSTITIRATLGLPVVNLACFATFGTCVVVKSSAIDSQKCLTKQSHETRHHLFANGLASITTLVTLNDSNTILSNLRRLDLLAKVWVLQAIKGCATRPTNIEPFVHIVFTVRASPIHITKLPAYFPALPSPTAQSPSLQSITCRTCIRSKKGRSTCLSSTCMRAKRLQMDRISILKPAKSLDHTPHLLSKNVATSERLRP